MKKKVVIVASSVLIAGGVGVVGYSVLNQKEPVEQDFTVETKKGDIQVNITATGVVSPTTVENIVPTENGTIKESFLEDGKSVKQGDLLVSFEGEDVSQDLAQQEANLEKQKIDLSTLQKSLSKYKENLVIKAKYNGIIKEILVDVGEDVQPGQTVAVIDVDGEMKNIEVKTSGEVFVLNVSEGDTVSDGERILSLITNEELENQIKKQQLDIESVHKSIVNLNERSVVPESIYAPFDGEIKVTNESAVGSQINLNSVLGTITNYGEFKLNLSVDELDVPNIKVGQKVEISADAYPEESFSGEVIKIASQGESVNGVSTFKVEVSINDPKGLKSGMTANARIVVSKANGTLLLPVEAVKEKESKQYVTIKTPNGNKEVDVTTGLNNANYIEIVSGVKEGQKVVLPITSSQNEKSVFGPMGDQGGNH